MLQVATSRSLHLTLLCHLHQAPPAHLYYTCPVESGQTGMGPCCTWGERRTTRVHDEAAGAAADREAAGLDAQPGDLALLQQVLEPREVLDAPHKRAVVRVRAAARRRLALARRAQPAHAPRRLRIMLLLLLRELPIRTLLVSDQFHAGALPAAAFALPPRRARPRASVPAQHVSAPAHYHPCSLHA